MTSQQIISIIILGVAGYLGYQLFRKHSQGWGCATIFFVIGGVMFLGNESVVADSSVLIMPVWGLIIGGIGYFITSKRVHEDCPKCDKKTHATKKLFFKDSKEEYTDPGIGSWVSGLVGLGLALFGISYLIVVGFTDFWLYAVGMLFVGLSLLNSAYKQFSEFRAKRKDLVERLEFFCPNCKHKWIRQE